MADEQNQNIKNDLEEIEKCQQKVEEYLNNWKRERADFMNYKKDESKRVENALEFGKEVILEDFIEVKDELERALQWGDPKEHELDTSWREGIEMTLKKFDGILRRYDVDKIPMNIQFNPELHEAVSIEEGGDKLEEIRAGYTLHGRVIRPARVRIIS
jgi:molecular chaperone GrpE